MAGARPAAAGADEGLRGSRCPGCGVAAYPAVPDCPRCGGPAAPVALSGTGTLWTWTVQRFAPKAPPYAVPADGFRPFLVGYVELPEGVRVLAVLDGVRPEDAVIGMPLDLTAGAGVPRARRARRPDPAEVTG